MKLINLKNTTDSNNSNTMGTLSIFGFIMSLFLLINLSNAAEDTDVEMKPLSAGALISLGQGYNVDQKMTRHPEFDSRVFLRYTQLWFVQSATVGERLDVNLGIAGTNFFPYPERNIDGFSSYKTGGVSVFLAEGTYKLGDVETPWLKISAGQMKYKYNPYTKTFGEYAFRTEAYPTTVRTGDWGAINNAVGDVWGAAFKFQFMDGMLKNDLIFGLSEQQLPLHDISITNLTTLSFGGILEFGGGLVFSRVIPVDEDKTKLKINDDNAWIEWTQADTDLLRTTIAADTSGKILAYFDANSFYVVDENNFGNKVDTLPEAGEYWVSSSRPIVKAFAGQGAMPSDLIDSANVGVLANLNALDKRNQKQYLSPQSINAIVKGHLDIKPLMGMDAFGDQDLVLYFELAALGFNKNYPIYYTEASQRMPFMIGFNIPTFKFLDFLAVEVEWMKNPYINSNWEPVFRKTVPKSVFGGEQVAAPQIADPLFDAGMIEPEFTDDDFKWAITAQKTWGRLNAAFQIADDHFRPIEGNFSPTPTEMTAAKDSWYYMFKLQVNL